MSDDHQVTAEIGVNDDWITPWLLIGLIFLQAIHELTLRSETVSHIAAFVFPVIALVGAHPNHTPFSVGKALFLLLAMAPMGYLRFWETLHKRTTREEDKLQRMKTNQKIGLDEWGPGPQKWKWIMNFVVFMFLLNIFEPASWDFCEFLTVDTRSSKSAKHSTTDKLEWDDGSKWPYLLNCISGLTLITVMALEYTKQYTRTKEDLDKELKNDYNSFLHPCERLSCTETFPQVSQIRFPFSPRTILLYCCWHLTWACGYESDVCENIKDDTDGSAEVRPCVYFLLDLPMLLIPALNDVLRDQGIFAQSRVYTLIVTIGVYEFSCSKDWTEWLLYGDHYSKDLHITFSVITLSYALCILAVTYWALVRKKDVVLFGVTFVKAGGIQEHSERPYGMLCNRKNSESQKMLEEENKAAVDQPTVEMGGDSTTKTPDPEAEP